MPVFYLKYGNSKTDSYLIQTNNPTEEMLRKNGVEDFNSVAQILNGKVDQATIDIIGKKVKSFLETCGPTSACAIIGACWGETALSIKTPGGYLPQPEQVLTDYFNDPFNYPKLKAAANWFDPTALFGNEAAVWYPTAVKDVFGVNAKFVGKLSFEQIREYIKLNQGVQIVLKNPGHFLAVVGVDTDKSELIYNDSWPNRHADGDGFNKRMTLTEFQTNVKDSCVVYNL